MWFSQSEVVLHSKSGEKDKDCSKERMVNASPVFSIFPFFPAMFSTQPYNFHLLACCPQSHTIICYWMTKHHSNPCIGCLLDNPLPHKTAFWHTKDINKVVENIVRKEEVACNKWFLLFSQCFLPYMVLIFHFKCTLKCRLQFVWIWTSLKFCHLVMG